MDSCVLRTANENANISQILKQFSPQGSQVETPYAQHDQHPFSTRDLHRLGPQDILSRSAYARCRRQWLTEIRGYLRRRRVRLSDSISILVENAITVRHQVQEVLYWETSDDQAARARTQEELDVYRTLLPQPNRLAATLLVDGGSPDLGVALGQALALGCSGIGICIDGSVVAARLAEADPDPSEPVKFLRFDLTPQQRRAFLAGGGHAIRMSDGQAYSLKSLRAQTVMSLRQDIQHHERQGPGPQWLGATGMNPPATAAPDRQLAPGPHADPFRPLFGMS